MGNPLYPLAVKRITGENAGSYIGGPPRGVWHETITAPTAFYRKDTYYHIQFREWPIGSTPQIEQAIPFNLASKGLRNLTSAQRVDAGLSSQDIATNRMGSVNINAALVGYQTYRFQTPPAVSYPALYPLSEAMVDTLATFMLWCKDEWGIPADVSRLLDRPGQHEAAYITQYRLSNAQWAAFTGWCGHELVTENTHHDPYYQFPKHRLTIEMASPEGDDTMKEAIAAMKLFGTPFWTRCKAVTGQPGGDPAYWGGTAATKPSDAEWTTAYPILWPAALLTLAAGVADPLTAGEPVRIVRA